MGERYDDGGDYEHLTPGAPFRSFLMKYPEINYLNKRIRGVSSRLAELEEGGSVYSSIRRSLWRAQANDAFWHGVFGGFYLPHLRRALYENMLQAESAIDEELGVKSFSMTYDVDGDGFPEVVLKNNGLLAVVAPNEGLSLKELSGLNAGICFTDTIARRFEVYHRDLSPGSDDESVRTIHADMGSKEDGLDELLIYDEFPKRLFYDLFLNETISNKGYFNGDIPEDARFNSSGFSTNGMEVRSDIVSAEKDGTVIAAFNKMLTLNDNGLSAFWSGRSNRAGRLGSELSFNFWSPDAEYSNLRYNEADYPLHCPNVLESLKKFNVADRLANWEIVIESDRPISLWHYPIYTISRSESGYEKVFQGVTFFPSIFLNAGETIEWGLNVRIKK